jgi:arginyl-tRNA synthetase
LYGKDPSIGLRNAFSTGLGRKKLVIEFSSPNIVNELESKHVRSTVLGACIANLYENMGWDVVRINYLGDWGMQMGLLGVGWEKFGSEEEFRADPVRHMFSIYSKIDKVFQSEVVARRVAFEDGLDTISIETQGLFAERDAFFRRIQDGDDEALALWKRFRDVTIEHYNKLYARLNVRFDEYSGESQVSLESMGEVEEMLKSKGISEESDGAWIVGLGKHRLRGGGIATIRSRNQNRTYLLRDLAAVVDRSRRYSFDRMIYVVADDHDQHFRRLFHILELLNMHDVADMLEYVRFNKGRQKGHGYTSGDIFDQCLNSMHESLVANPDKAALLYDSEYPVADLGISALVAQELSVKRGTDYHFDFLKMALFEGATGPNLQYWHSRLCSMLKATSFDLNIFSDEDFTRVEEIELLRVLAQYPSITSSAYQFLDPSIVLHYLVQITDQLSFCIENKKSLEESIATPARAALFESTRQVLENGMKLLGIMPPHG